MVRAILMVVTAAAIAAGCSLKNAGRDPRGQMYDSKAIAEFNRETGPPGLESEYVIGAGDRLDIVFFVHKELTMLDLLVRSDGRITLPYVGDVLAAGTTPMLLDSTLTVSFSEVLRDPNLSVIVREPAERVVYVLGQVENPGGYPYKTDVSLVGSLALAGGLTRGAKTSHVLVIRRKGPEKIVGIEVNVGAITSGYNVENDLLLRNYDIVYVPKTRLESTAEFISILNDIFFPPVDIALRGWQLQVLNQQLEVLKARN